MILNTYVTSVLRPDYIYRMIETLYKYTDMSHSKLIVIDQTLNGLKLPRDKVHLVISPNRNLGFAKSQNEGIIHALHWGSEYITCINDDLEFMNSAWFDGIMETFRMESAKEILMVAPESPRIALWGYGDTKGNYVEVIPYKETFTEEDYQYLLKGDFSNVKYDTNGNELPKTFPKNYTGVCDALAAWGPVCKRKVFTEIGLWDERIYPGGFEDYDMMARIYSKGYRAVSTRKSWIWHWWSKTRDNDQVVKDSGMPIEKERYWQDGSYLWPKEWNEGNNMDVWGFYTSKDGTRKPFKRREEIGVVEI